MSAAERWDEFDDLPPLLKPSEVATILRTTTKAVWVRKQRGQLPGVVMTGKREFLVRKSILLRSLAQGRASP